MVGMWLFWNETPKGLDIDTSSLPTCSLLELCFHQLSSSDFSWLALQTVLEGRRNLGPGVRLLGPESGDEGTGYGKGGLLVNFAGLGRHFTKSIIITKNVCSARKMFAAGSFQPPAQAFRDGHRVKPSLSYFIVDAFNVQIRRMIKSLVSTEWFNILAFLWFRFLSAGHAARSDGS